MVKTNDAKARLDVAASPATDTAAEPDPYHGQGGSYVMENGVRRLVARTKTQAEAATEAKAQGDAAGGQAEPA